MKKILLLNLIALATMGSAQILVTESFENGTSPGFAITGGYTGTAGTYLGSTCDGPIQIGAEVYGSSVANRTVNLIYTKPASITANGKMIDVSFNYTTVAYDATSSIGGTITVAYSTDNGANYTTIGSPITLTSTAQTCAQFTGTIPESANVNGNFMLRIQTLGTTGLTYDFYSFIDKVSIKQQVTALPTCTTISSPVAGATGVSVRPQITWGAVAGAENYKVKVGTTPGGSNVYNGTTTNTSFTPASNSVFPANTQLYTTVTPSNTLGDAAGCTEISFTTGANPFAPYCGTLQAKLGVYPISNVVFSNVNNSSSATANAGSGHENFISSAATVTRGTSYPITLTGTGAGTNRFAFTVFIDWNQNGSFADPGESYFVTSDFAGGTGNTVTVNKNILVPATALVGSTRMRVKFQFNSSTTSVRTELSDPCSDLNEGQAEDYTVTVENTLATNDINNIKTDINVYPNPFQDVLNISDIKNVKYILVSDITGRKVKTLKATTQLNLSELNSGLYLISLQMEDGSVKTVKAIKK